MRSLHNKEVPKYFKTNWKYIKKSDLLNFNNFHLVEIQDLKYKQFPNLYLVSPIYSKEILNFRNNAKLIIKQQIYFLPHNFYIIKSPLVISSTFMEGLPPTKTNTIHFCCFWNFIYQSSGLKIFKKEIITIWIFNWQNINAIENLALCKQTLNISLLRIKNNIMLIYCI